MHSNFVHLHTHSYYSLLDGALPVDVICNKAKEYKMPSVALTDHGNLFGAVEFYQKAMASGVKPIIGCEVYILNKGDRREKVPYRDGQGLCHLTLLVKNHKGYQNLSKLITSGYLEGFYYKPRIDKEILEQHCEGLIALSACFKGEVPGLFKKGLDNEARKAAEYYSSLFGQSRFYLEIMRHGLEGQDEVNDKLLSLSKELGIPVVATNDSHYRSKDDAEAQDALICIQTGKLLEDTDRLKMEGSEFYFKSPEAMKLLFEDIPEAIDNTVEIAQRCNFEFDFKTYHFPHFTAPEGKDLATYLEESTIEGLNKRWSLIQSHNKNKNENELKEFYMSRIKRELDLIKSMGFAGYFLIVADFIGYAKKSDIPVGPGRGSAAGSLVAYCLGITNIDPMPYHLLFERFLNPERISMPDMDIDFCMRQRDKVIQYVSEKYGNVSQIITFGKMKARAVVRDVGRVLNMSYSDVDRIAKLIPNTLGITLDVALKVEPQLKDAQKKDPCVERLLAIARKLEGFPRHASTHAAGVVMADQPLVNFLPLYKGQNDEIVTQFDMKNVEKIGLIKFDFLGLKTLTVIDDALKIVKRTRNQDLNIEDIPMDDENVYKQLSLGNTAGVFQLESSGMTDLVMRLKPNLFEDIVALVALFRPGPLGSGMVDDFIARKHGQVAIEYIIPELEEILKDTYGVIVYQEQVMQIASKLANYTLGDADILRRAMGKKNIDEMDEQKEKFLAGSKKNKLPPVKAAMIFDLMAKFAEYGFNKSHSAAYALVAYQTAYLKTYFITEYMAALLSCEMGNTDKIITYINDCQGHDIQVLPPDVNESYRHFSVVEDKKIRFGLAAVKNVGDAAIESIVQVRKEGGAFIDFFDFCERVDSRRVNKRVIENLIKCGAFDSLKAGRHQLMEAMNSAMDMAAKNQRDRESGQTSMFGAFQNTDASGVNQNLPEVDPWPENKTLTFEKESLGFYITGHPLAQFEKLIAQYANVDTVSVMGIGDKAEVRIGGVVSKQREITTKKGDRMAFVTLEDLKGFIEVVVFPEAYKKGFDALRSDKPIFVIGNTDSNEETVKIIADDIMPIHDMASKLTKSIHLHLSAPEIDSKHLQQLKQILGRHGGECSAYLHISIPDKSETIMSLPENLKVAPSLQLVAEVEKLFGHNVIKFESKEVSPSAGLARGARLERFRKT